MDDYEALPASASLSVTCAAGALAGVAEHCVMFPIDSVKVREIEFLRYAQGGRVGPQCFGGGQCKKYEISIYLSWWLHLPLVHWGKSKFGQYLVI